MGVILKKTPHHKFSIICIKQDETQKIVRICSWASGSKYFQKKIQKTKPLPLQKVAPNISNSDINTILTEIVKIHSATAHFEKKLNLQKYKKYKHQKLHHS